MIRVALAVLGPLMAVVLVAAWAAAPPAALPARFSLDDCRRVSVFDAETGNAVAGAEDIVRVEGGDTLILSGRADPEASRAQGGLYAVSLWSLGDGGDAVARPLLGRRDEAFRPHGIGISPDGARLAVVNRVAEGRAVIESGPLGPDGWQADTVADDPRFCRANDVDFAGATALRVTLDRADCTVSLRDLAGGTGAVALVEGSAVTVERVGLAFPNGIAGSWVAETRGRRLRGPDGTVDLPGGPDNIGFSDGRLIAALHPNLMRMGLFLNGWTGSAASRIVAADPVTREVEVLFDDPEGRLFSGATVGVLAGDRLVAGSVRDTGLLYCEGGR